MNAPNICSVVLVAGSALDDIQAVMDKVDSLVEDMLQIPYAVFLLYNGQKHVWPSRHYMTPNVVSMHWRFMICRG